jgi:Asp-tRNA(Asn)/Glu-tRNA(Gln) amidotransferase C subunit
VDVEEVRRRAGVELDEAGVAAVAELLERVIGDAQELEEELDLEGVEPFAVP